MKLGTVLTENWFVPLNDYMPEEFLNSFADGALNEGITTMDGKVYVLPESANIINTLMFYNKTVLTEAGVDVENLPTTWSEFIDVCKQVTEAGKGRYYGIIDSGAQANRLELAIRSLASLDGAKCSDISQMILVDGQNTMNTQAMQNAFQFYDTLVKEGCFHPNSVSMKAPEARALFAQNMAAFYHSGRMVHFYLASGKSRFRFWRNGSSGSRRWHEGQTSLRRRSAMDGNFFSV